MSHGDKNKCLMQRAPSSIFRPQMYSFGRDAVFQLSTEEVDTMVFITARETSEICCDKLEADLFIHLPD